MHNSLIAVDVKPTEPAPQSPTTGGERELEAIIEEARRRKRRRRFAIAAVALLAGGSAPLAVLLLDGSGGTSGSPPRVAAEGAGAPGPLLVHRVRCFCSPEYFTTTTIHDDGRTVVRFAESRDLEPATFELDSAEVAEIEQALASIDFTDLPKRVIRDDANVVFDARAVRLTHAGHTVYEPTQVPSLDGASPTAALRAPPSPLPLVLEPVDALVEAQLESLRARRFGLPRG